MRLFLILAAILMPAVAQAQNVRTAIPGTPPPAATIEDIAWLAGHWEGEGLGGTSIETISPPVGGQMAGHFQQVKDGKIWFYELYQFAPAGNSLTLRLKHFNADLTGWEEKAKTVEFPLVAVEKDAVYFDGLTYRRTADGGLEGFVVIREDDGKTEEVAFRLKRKPL